MASAKVTKVELIPKGMAELLKDRGVAADMLQRAERVAESARASAPVLTGAYRDSIEASLEITDRAEGRVGASVRYAVYVEADTGNLARALDAAG